MIDYFQNALHSFNLDTSNWYGWKKFDAQGNKIPNNQRMCYECIEIIKDGAVMPTKAEVEAKIQELKNEEANRIAKKESAKAKLAALGLDEEEIKAIIGA